LAQENVDLVLASNDAYNSGDIDATLACFSSDIEAFPDASVFPDAAPLHGRQEFRRWLEEASSAWVGARWIAKEVRASAGGQVMLRGDWGGQGAASGAETVSRITGVFTIRDGQICRVEYFFDHAKALRAVGLAE